MFIIKKNTLTTDKVIWTITIVFGAIALYHLYQQFGFVRFALTEGFGMWDTSILEIFLPLFLLPVAVFLFALRKKSGWVLMAVFLSYSAINTLGLILMTSSMETGIPAMDSLFPQPSPITYLLRALFFVGTLWVISKSDVMKAFGISRRTAAITMVTSGILTIAFIAQFYF